MTATKQRDARSTRAPARQSRLNQKLSSSRTFRGTVGLIVFMVLMEIVTRLAPVDAAFLPPASAALKEAFVILRGDFPAAVAETMFAWSVALASTVAVGVTLGAALGSSDLAYRVSRAVIDFVRTIPSVALIPLFILLWGTGLHMKTLTTLCTAVWPIMFNTIYGVHDVDPIAKDTARSFGLTKLQIARRVVLPSAAPFIATGIRLASSMALLIVITVELLVGGGKGIGGFMVQVQSSGVQTNAVFAATIMTGVLGVLVNSLFSYAESKKFGWQHGRRA